VLTLPPLSHFISFLPQLSKLINCCCAVANNIRSVFNELEVIYNIALYKYAEYFPAPFSHTVQPPYELVSFSIMAFCSASIRSRDCNCNVNLQTGSNPAAV
jgi:hypothetical protein